MLLSINIKNPKSDRIDWTYVLYIATEVVGMLF